MITEPYFRFLMEDDYKFLLTIKYGNDIDVNKLYSDRVRNGLIVIIFCVFLFMSKFTFIYFIFSRIIFHISCNQFCSVDV